MSETDLVKACMELIEMRGGIPLRINSGVRVIPGENGEKSRVFRGAPAGTSDIIALYHGRYLAVECKMPGNEATPAQENFLSRVYNAGGMAILAFDVEFLNTCLDAIDQSILYDVMGVYYNGTPQKGQ